MKRIRLFTIGVLKVSYLCGCNELLPQKFYLQKCFKFTVINSNRMGIPNQ